MVLRTLRTLSPEADLVWDIRRVPVVPVFLRLKVCLLPTLPFQFRLEPPIDFAFIFLHLGLVEWEYAVLL